MVRCERHQHFIPSLPELRSNDFPHSLLRAGCKKGKEILLLRSVPTNIQSHLLLHVVSIYFNKQQSLSIYFTSPFLRSVGSFEKWLPRDVMFINVFLSWQRRKYEEHIS